ncbi:MAG: nucleotidyltransferase domain-containing protein [Bacteroidales bacterium]|nr:nucleotidyltransferase domain-containing protein [Bacteroidales bacterium]
MELIRQHTDEIVRLCDKHYVSELYVFGSVLTSTFNSDSDIDLLVRFGNVNLMDYFDNYMDFKESLEKLFNRTVDLVETQTLKNPILKRAIENQKKLIYGRKGFKVVV